MAFKPQRDLAPIFFFHLPAPMPGASHTNRNILLCLYQEHPPPLLPAVNALLTFKIHLECHLLQVAFLSSCRQSVAPSSMPRLPSGHFPVIAHTMLLLYLSVSLMAAIR